MKRPLGVILYRGPSRINGKDIVCVATFRSKNRKTGNMIQTWILLTEESPTNAIHDGKDEAICGACPLRGIVEQLKTGKFASRNRFRGCYVTVKQAPTNVYKAFKNDRYPIYDSSIHAKYFKGRKIRLGAYGDPVAVPLASWQPVLKHVSSHTGYTHSWKIPKFRYWSKYIMASTHNEAENQVANNRGWRTFRTRTANQPIATNEIVCPAAKEGGERLNCNNCLACAGGRPEQRSIVIIGHGSRAVMSGVNKISKAA